MTQCSEFRREMSTQGRRGLLYIYTIIMAPLPRFPAPSLSLGVPSLVSGPGNIYDFILFIKCSSFSLSRSSPFCCHNVDDDIYNFLRTFVA